MTRVARHFRLDPKVDELLTLCVENASKGGLKITKTAILERAFVNEMRRGLKAFWRKADG